MVEKEYLIFLQNLARGLAHIDISSRSFQRPAFLLCDIWLIRPKYLHLSHNIIQLPQDIILEGVIINYKCDFYTTNSATAIYSYTSGARCYTYIPLLKKFTSHFDNIPLKEIFTEIPIPE